MNKDVMWEAIAHLEPGLIEEADQPTSPKERNRWCKIFLIAAAACLILAVGVVAAESIFGFQILEMRNDGDHNYYSLMAEETVKFPISQFGETVQDYIQNGMPVLNETEAESSGQGAEASVVTFDVPTFPTWDEAAEFVGPDIPLLEENPVLARGSHQDFSVYVSRNSVDIHTVYSVDVTSIMFSASIAPEGAEPYKTGAVFQGSKDVTITSQKTVTGSGTDVLLYVTTGEHSACDAYFIQDGILYNLFITNGNMDLMEEILAAF